MKKIYLLLLLVLLISFLTADKYAGEIFKLRAGVRNYALGNTGVTDINSYATAYWNPAILPLVKQKGIEFMHAEEYNGLLKYDTINFRGNSDFPFSAVITRIGINDIPITKLNDEQAELSNDNRPYIDRYVDNSDYVLYLGYGSAVNDKFYIGATPKLVYRRLVEENGYGFGMDIGVLYMISDNFLTGLKINDAFTTQIIWPNSDKEAVIPSFDLEFSYLHNFDKKGLKAIRGVGMAEIITDFAEDDITVQLGDLGVDFHAGIEYVATENLQLMVGYDIDNLTAGIGFNINKYILNYAYEHELEDELDNSHRISAGVKF
ncbi:MAG: hypothetical protein P9L91_01900 [Candidatus Zophobacter franzmannii]|jgi:hypothetical protein|nr:hypothetical protein [Candidatus Zophobacter franzmannii]